MSVHFVTKKELAECLFDYIGNRDREKFRGRMLLNCELRAAGGSAGAAMAMRFNEALKDLPGDTPIFAIEAHEMPNGVKGGDS